LLQLGHDQDLPELLSYDMLCENYIIFQSLQILKFEFNCFEKSLYKMLNIHVLRVILCVKFVWECFSFSGVSCLLTQN